MSYITRTNKSKNNISESPNNPKQNILRHWLVDAYTEREIAQVVKQLQNNKAHGTDGIPGEVYKELTTQLTKPLTSIRDIIGNREKLPELWKKGAIIHI